MEFAHSRVETLPLRKDQFTAVSLSLVVGITAGLIIGYLKPMKLGAVVDSLFAVAFAICGAGLGSLSIGLKDSKGILAWMPFGLIGVMGSLGLQPFASFPIGLFASWASSFVLICCYHVWTNRVT